MLLLGFSVGVNVSWPVFRLLRFEMRTAHVANVSVAYSFTQISNVFQISSEDGAFL